MKPFIMGNKQGETNLVKWFNYRIFFTVSGILATILVWQILSMIFPRIIIASPASTFVALVNLATDGSLWRQLGYSLMRLLIGLGIGSLAGIGLGVVAGLNRRIQLFLEPIRWVAMTVPAIIITVLALLWFGIGSAPVIFMTAVITVPITYVNTLEGMLAVDARIIEMSAIYRIPAGMRLREIYLPGIGSAIMAGLTLASGVGVRALILAEFMGARNGVGHSLFIAWTFLDTPALFAWILVAFGLLGLVEFGVLRPVRDHLTRWKKT